MDYFITHLVKLVLPEWMKLQRPTNNLRKNMSRGLLAKILICIVVYSLKLAKN